MKGQIKILFYPSCRSIADELIEKLKQGCRPFSRVMLEEGSNLSSASIDSDVSMNVLIVCQNDIPLLKSVQLEGFPCLNTIKKDKSLSVVFCINISEIPSWFSKYFLIKETSDSAEEIRRDVVRIHNQIYQSNKGRYGYFVGRNSEIEQFQNLLYSERSSRISAMVVSGRPGVGREAYIRECIRQAKGIDNYEPYLLSMGKNGNIELFLVQLNSIHHLYSENALISILGSSTEEKVNTAVSMLNELFGDDDYLLLYDDGAACVRYDRVLSDWFKSVTTHPMLKGGIHLYVISNISVSYMRMKAVEDLAFITLYGLTLSDRKKLLYKCLSEYSITLPQDQVDYLAEKLVYSPSQLLKVAEDAKDTRFDIIKANIINYQIVGDYKILPLVKNYISSDLTEARNILVLLSRIEYLNNRLLYSIFSDNKLEIDKSIDRFMVDGIVERFGEWMDLIRLDSSVSDYIRRIKMDYTDNGMRSLVMEKLDEFIETAPKITEDYTTFLFKLKRGVQQGRIDKESFLVPSVLVNTIAEAYDARRWLETISLCESILDAHPNYFSDVFREIRYWYCLALARIQAEDKFYQTVHEFSGADFLFLKGFYYRIGKQYSRAEEEYIKALRINPSFSRVKREMVIVLQAQHKFREALELSMQNYERDPDNPYHAHALFRCLVHKNGLSSEERLLLKGIKDDPNNLFKAKRGFTEGMDFEYKRYVDRAKPEVLLPSAAELLKKYKGVAYIQDIVDDYYVSLGMKPHLVPVDYSDEFND